MNILQRAKDLAGLTAKAATPADHDEILATLKRELADAIASQAALENERETVALSGEFEAHGRALYTVEGQIRSLKVAIEAAEKRKAEAEAADTMADAERQAAEAADLEGAATEAWLKLYGLCADVLATALHIDDLEGQWATFTTAARNLGRDDILPKSNPVAGRWRTDVATSLPRPENPALATVSSVKDNVAAMAVVAVTQLLRRAVHDNAIEAARNLSLVTITPADGGHSIINTIGASGGQHGGFGNNHADPGDAWLASPLHPEMKRANGQSGARFADETIRLGEAAMAAHRAEQDRIGKLMGR